MKFRVIFLALLASLTLFISCSQSEVPETLQVRMYNATNLTLEEVKVVGVNREVSFGDMGPRSATGFRQLDPQAKIPLVIFRTPDQNLPVQLQGHDGSIRELRPHTYIIEYAVDGKLSLRVQAE